MRRKVDVRWSVPVHLSAHSLLVSVRACRASKESLVPKPFRRIAPNVEKDEAPVPVGSIRGIRTDANPRRA